MRSATRVVAASLGFVAGIAGLEHGYFEILRGNTTATSLAFPSMGPPCIAEKIWNACEPAMSIIPNFLIMGILAVIIGLMIMIWSVFFVQRKHGGLILILLSVALLLFGGGFFPPLIGAVGGAAGMRIDKPIERKPAERPQRIAAELWPGPLIVLLAWLFGQFPVGYFFNDFLQSIMGFGVLLILAMLPLSVYAAYAHDVLEQNN